MGGLSRRAVLAALAASVVVGCGDGSAEQTPPPPADAPPGFLVYLVEHEEPACPDPCDDSSPSAGDQTAWLETVQADGSGARRVTCVWANPLRCKEGEPPSGRYGPAIAPSGRWFASHDVLDVESKEPGEVLVHDLDGRVVERHTVPGQTRGVSWSPDERYLAVEGDWPSSHRGPLHIVDRKRGTRRLIARHAGAVKWSSRNLLATRRLTVMRPDGRVVHRFRNFGPTDAYDWSPSGKTLAFGCRDGICAARYDGTKRRVLTRRCRAFNDSTNVAWSPDGEWIACTRRGNVVAVRLRDDHVRVVREVSEREMVWDIDWGPTPAK